MVETGVLAVLSPYLAGLLEGPGAPSKAPAGSELAPRATVPRLEYEDDEPDVDDPPRKNPPRPRSPRSSKSSMTRRCPGTRCWAEEPRARPAKAQPVQLSFVDAGGDLARRRALGVGDDGADRCGGRGGSRSVERGRVRVAARAVRARRAARERFSRPRSTSSPIRRFAQLHVTRRDAERLRYLLVAQRKLALARKKGVQAELAGGRDLIDDAVLLFGLLERAQGRDISDLPAPAATGGNGGRSSETGEDGEVGAEGEPRKRRRRRRGGRRR